MNHISITTLEAPELDIYARLSEGQLFHYNEPKEGLFIAESPKVIGRALDAGYEPVSFLMEERHIETEGREILERPVCAGETEENAGDRGNLCRCQTDRDS